MLRRYWFEFSTDRPEDLPPGVRIGCGVTAYDIQDATALVQQLVFDGRSVPSTRKVLIDVDITTLDAGHVRPNMGNPVQRGVWFPLGY